MVFNSFLKVSPLKALFCVFAVLFYVCVWDAIHKSGFPPPANVPSQLQNYCRMFDDPNTIVGTQKNIGSYFNKTEAFFSEITSSEHPNCRSFRSVFFMPPVTREESEFPLAFTIVLHKDAEQFARLLRMLHRASNYYCIHIDQRSSPKFEAAINGLVNCFGSNVELVPKNRREKVYWGDNSVLRPQLICAERALHRPAWRYLINLSGQEFPLRTNLELVAIMKALNNSNLMEAFTIDPFKHWTKGVELPNKMQWFKGSIYGAYRREFMDFLFHNDFSRALLEALFSPKKLLHPDELCFQTLAFNPHIGAPGACRWPPIAMETNEGFLARFVLWSDRRPFCPTKFNRGVCILGRPHLPQLKRTPHMIANKFYADYEPEAYDCLEFWYFERIRREYELGGRYDPEAFTPSPYANILCSKDHLP